MPGNRQAATAYILQALEEILPKNKDVAQYRVFLDGMSDADFDKYMHDLRSGKRYLTLTSPNHASTKLWLDKNVELAKKWKVKLHQKLWITGDEETPTHLTPIEFLVIPVTVRVASQRLQKKMSIPKTQRVINALTGQPTGDSKGASISYPELRVCAAMGLENSMVELMKYRGGDARGGAALTASLVRTGHASLKTLHHFASGVESTQTLKTFLTSIHLRNTL